MDINICRIVNSFFYKQNSIIYPLFVSLRKTASLRLPEGKFFSYFHIFVDFLSLS